MKNHLLLFACLIGTILISSCKKDTQDPNTNTGGGSTSWNWAGTVPFSVKLDGVSYTVPANKITIFDIFGYYNINAELTDDLSVALSLETTITTGEYNTPSPNNFTHTNQVTGFQGGALTNGGKIKIIQNTATLIEGKFYGTVTSPINSQTHTLAEGYFKITK